MVPNWRSQWVLSDKPHFASIGEEGWPQDEKIWFFNVPISGIICWNWPIFGHKNENKNFGTYWPLPILSPLNAKLITLSHKLGQYSVPKRTNNDFWAWKFDFFKNMVIFSREVQKSKFWQKYFGFFASKHSFCVFMVVIRSFKQNKCD